MRSMVVVLLAGAVVGCVPSPPRTFDSPEPAARIDAIVGAAGREDESSIPALVLLLESDDPATRMLAVRTLEKLTGETNGYDYAASETDRRAAIVRWRRWLSDHGAETAERAQP